jgi:hypothetical protein
MIAGLVLPPVVVASLFLFLWFATWLDRLLPEPTSATRIGEPSATDL